MLTFSMKCLRALVAACALGAVSLSANALVFLTETDQFTVYTNDWLVDDYVASGNTMTANMPFVCCRSSYSEFGGVYTDYARSTDELYAARVKTLDWVAKPGFRVTGYSVTYSLRFSGSSYVLSGGEFDGNGLAFGGLPAGTLWESSAIFKASTGPSISFLGAGALTASLTHRVSGTHFDPIIYMLAVGQGDFCPALPEGCGSGYPGWRATSLQLTSISATPVVSAIPEPSTYALMLAGIAALGLATRRNKRS